MKTLETLIKTSGIKQKVIADALHVDPSLVSKWMNGSRTPTEAQYQGLSRLFQVPLDALILDKHTVKPTLNMDLITLLNFKGYLNLKYSILSLILLISTIIFFLFDIIHVYAGLFLFIVGMTSILVEVTRIFSPPKKLISFHMQSTYVSHTYIKDKSFDVLHHHRQGMVYYIILFFLQPLLLISLYEISTLYEDTVTPLIISISLLLTLSYNGYAMLSYIFKKYSQTPTYHHAHYRLNEVAGQVIKTITIIQSVFVFTSYVFLDIQHPLKTFIWMTTVLLFILGHLIHQHHLIFGSYFAFDFKEKMDKTSIS